MHSNPRPINVKEIQKETLFHHVETGGMSTSPTSAAALLRTWPFILIPCPIRSITTPNIMSIRPTTANTHHSGLLPPPLRTPESTSLPRPRSAPFANEDEQDADMSRIVVYRFLVHQVLPELIWFPFLKCVRYKIKRLISRKFG